MARETISELLAYGRDVLVTAGISDADARLESRLLIQHATGKSAEQLIGNVNEIADDEAVGRFRVGLERRRLREPLAYIVGAREFYGRRFSVDRRVLVPRPESELLVEHALEFATRAGLTAPRIRDLGTGSGVLALTLALELPQSEVVASDISSDALDVARANARDHGVSDRIDFKELDMTRADISEAIGRFDIIVANPPYIPTQRLDTELEPEVRDWEPRLALDGGSDGLVVLGLLIDRIPQLLGRSGRSAAYIEIDDESAEACLARAQASNPDARVEVQRDGAGMNRILAIETAGADA